MSITIKFRAKMKNKNKWVYGDLLSPINSDYNQYMIFEYNGGAVKIKPNTIGFSIGLKDKHGVELYTGDFIKSKYGYIYCYDFEDYKIIIRDKWGNQIKPTQQAIDHFECECIGNNYETPELFEEGL